MIGVNRNLKIHQLSKYLTSNSYNTAFVNTVRIISELSLQNLELNMTNEFESLTVKMYAEKALATDKRSDSASLTFPLLGLFGETGSLLSEVKKKQRDSISYLGYASGVAEELGDVLWYLTVVADRSNLQLVDIVSELNLTFSDLNQVSKEMRTMASLQPELMPRSKEPTPAFEKTLLRLAGEVGSFINDHEAGLCQDNPSISKSRLVKIMSALVQASTDAGITIEAAAIKNLTKISDRWPSKNLKYPDSLDVDALEHERFPTTPFVVDIFERTVGENIYVFQRCNGVNIGDRLTDNSLNPDDYRFHDVFHYAYLAVLGWSPVMRDLFRLKRKSTPIIDEVQDGARAVLIEEGITTWIFGRAKELNFFADIKVGELPFDMLKHIRQFVSGYEVEHHPLWLWEEAILQGYDAFRFLQKNRCGRLTIDTHNHRLSIESLT
jgi:NTP pyrophosphatase (non-canonical NTP hydrolase)